MDQGQKHNVEWERVAKLTAPGILRQAPTQVLSQANKQQHQKP